MKKTALLSFAIIMIITFAACSKKTQVGNGARDYIVPAFVVAWHGPEYVADDVVAMLEESNEDGSHLVAIKKNDDGSVTLTMTQEQVDVMEKESLDVFYYRAADMAASSGCEMTINDERTAFVYKIRTGLSFSQRAFPLSMVQVACMYNQIFSGRTSDELALDYEIYNIENGELVIAGTLPQDSLDNAFFDGESLGLAQSYIIKGS